MNHECRGNIFRQNVHLMSACASAFVHACISFEVVVNAWGFKVLLFRGRGSKKLFVAVRTNVSLEFYEIISFRLLKKILKYKIGF